MSKPLSSSLDSAYAELRARYPLRTGKITKENGLSLLRAIAQLRGGECLAHTYKGMFGHHRFRCNQGHEWDTTASTIIQKRWCPVCRNLAFSAKNILSDGLLRLQQVAQDKGGLCLSKTYTGHDSKYRFRCAAGHEWETKALYITCIGCWCPACDHHRRRLSIDSMREIARSRGGLCLSEHYTNNVTKLQWQCSNGHTWWATPARVKHSTWCPECARLNNISNRKNLSARIKGKCIPQHSPDFDKPLPKQGAKATER